MIKHLLILGGGTAGTIMANNLRRRLPASEWRMTVVDRSDKHLYQPGLLFLPFGKYEESDFIPEGVTFTQAEMDQIIPEDHEVTIKGERDDLDFIATQKHMLQSVEYPDVFVIGDATNLPASKAGSVAHFESETLADNILLHIAGKPLKEEFDGHPNCFIESGNGKALLIDFSYDPQRIHPTTAARSHPHGWRCGFP